MADTSNLELIAGMNLKTEPFRAVLLEVTGLYIFLRKKSGLIWYPEPVTFEFTPVPRLALHP
jgi:hypothetical protein